MATEQKQPEAAVSPVIGVMLMIVVTIIIAAVVSAFAGGLAENQKKTPSAQIDVQIRTEKDISGSYYAQMLFVHKGGDPLPTHDLKIVTDGGNVIEGSNKTSPRWPCKNVNGECTDANQFGNVIWMSGDILATKDAASTAKILGTGAPRPQGTTASVDIVYIPTNEILFHKEVVCT